MLAEDICLHVLWADACFPGDQEGETRSVQQCSGGKASPSFELQALAQIVRDDVRRICDGDNRTTESQRAQLIRQRAQQFDRAGEQVQPCLPRFARLSDGDDDQRSVAALCVFTGAYNHRSAHEADAVRHVERLCRSLFPAQIDEYDFLAHASACQRVCAVASDVSCAENDNHFSSHDSSSCPGNNKTPPTSASSGQGRNVVCVRGVTLIRAKAPLPDTIISATGNVRPAVGHFSRPPQTILFRSLSGARTVLPSLRHADLIFLCVIGLCGHYTKRKTDCQFPIFLFSFSGKTGKACVRFRAGIVALSRTQQRNPAATPCLTSVFRV